MSKLSQVLLDAWQTQTGAPVMTTVDENGVSNSIYVKSVSIFNDEKIIIANNYFDKTFKNIENGCLGNFLFITDERKPYQLKGNYDYFTEGPAFDNMKTWNPSKHPGHGVAVLTVREIYSGSNKID
ncbi:MAG: hypothetical protein KAH14_01335 [Clostridiales bacterium]|nr:hypothetical protein [Clostridiales bacterium]